MPRDSHHGHSRGEPTRPRTPFAPSDDGYIDLADLASTLHAALDGICLQGYLDGKTSLRNLVALTLDCSHLEAERVVDTMESRGLLRFSEDPQRTDHPPGRWSIEVPP
ncbi:MAG: hypothetical protein MUF54_25320 [Polyangiaceae bacterium]|jgi:hypothetical protein|nr:hypothetical protein [Polyangiaceae bacterium]